MSRRLVIIESAREMGGVEFSTLYLASHLDPETWKGVVVCPGEGQLAAACREAGVRVESLPLPPLRSTSFRLGWGDFRLPDPVSWVWNAFAVLLAAGQVRKFLAQEQPDLVLTKGLYAHVCGGLAAKRIGTTCIWHVQDLVSERYAGLYKSVFSLLAKILPDGIIVDGTPIAMQLPKAIQDKVMVVLNGVDTQVYRPGLDGTAVRRELGVEPERLVIGHAARLTPWKGQHLLLKAFGEVAVLHPEVVLLLVGSPLFDSDAYEKQLRAQTREMGLDERVIFAGFRQDLPYVLAGMDMFAYPSIEKDTSPLSLISAMACGLPIAAFDIDGVREVLGDAGLLVPVGDVPELTSSLIGLIQDRQLRKYLEDSARQRVLTDFSLENHLVLMQKAFERYAQ